MGPVDPRSEEEIRRWPVWFARLANRVLRWSSMYCAADCGYPISGRFTVEIENWQGTRIVASVCSLGGVCETTARNHPRDDQGRSYPDFRPDIIAALKEMGDDQPPIVRLSLTR